MKTDAPVRTRKLLNLLPEQAGANEIRAAHQLAEFFRGELFGSAIAGQDNVGSCLR
jgi:hypothetical protein